MICSDAMGAAPELWSAFFAATGCWLVMGGQKMAGQTCQTHHQHPSKVTIRFESSWSGAVRTLGTSRSPSVGRENLRVRWNLWKRTLLCQYIGRVSKLVLNIVLEQRVLRQPPLRTCLDFSTREQS